MAVRKCTFGNTERIGNTDKWAGPLEPPEEPAEGGDDADKT